MKKMCKILFFLLLVSIGYTSFFLSMQCFPKNSGEDLINEAWKYFFIYIIFAMLISILLSVRAESLFRFYKNFAIAIFLYIISSLLLIYDIYTNYPSSVKLYFKDMW